MHRSFSIIEKRSNVNVIGYYDNFSEYKGNFNLRSTYDMGLNTLIYDGMVIDKEGVLVSKDPSFNPNKRLQFSILKEIDDLKSYKLENKNVHVTLVLSSRFWALLSRSDKRLELVNSITEMLLLFGDSVDGLVLDWVPHLSYEEYNNYIIFCKLLKHKILNINENIKLDVITRTFKSNRALVEVENVVDKYYLIPSDYTCTEEFKLAIIDLMVLGIPSNKLSVSVSTIVSKDVLYKELVYTGEREHINRKGSTVMNDMIYDNNVTVFDKIKLSLDMRVYNFIIYGLHGDSPYKERSIIESVKCFNTSVVTNKVWSHGPENMYKQGDIVFFKGKNYVCIKEHIPRESWDPVYTKNILWNDKLTDGETDEDKIISMYC